MSNRQVWVRRIGMPLVILLMAWGLTVWTTHRRQVQAEEVRQFVLDLCDDLATGRDPAPSLQGTDNLITGPLLSRLRSVVGRARESAAPLTVVATPGDTSPMDTAGIEATHTALILIGGRQVLGLRVVHPGDDGKIAIIGFWDPRPP